MGRKQGTLLQCVPAPEAPDFHGRPWNEVETSGTSFQVTWPKSSVAFSFSFSEVKSPTLILLFYIYSYAKGSQETRHRWLFKMAFCGKGIRFRSSSS